MSRSSPLAKSLRPLASLPRTPRAGALLLALALSGGCATTRVTSSNGKKPAEALQALLLRPAGCCQGATQETANTLAEELARRSDLRQAEVSQLAPPPPEVTANASAFLTVVLAKAQKAYLTMQMDEASTLLNRALERAQKTAAKGLTPKQLAELHLLLVAVSDAQRREDLVKHNSELAVGFNPELKPNADIFPPPVREAIDQARQQLERVDVSIRTEPAGALVSWDGVEQGQTPVNLPAQPRGRHYLLVEHPLCQPRREEVYLSTAAELKVELEPKERAQLIAAATALPELRPQATKLMGVKTTIWLAAQEDGALTLECASPGLAPRRLSLAAGSPSLLVRQAAETCLKHAAAATPPSPGRVNAQAASQPASAPADPGHFRRYWWAYAAAGAVALAAGITLPLVLQTEADSGRPIRLELPR